MQTVFRAFEIGPSIEICVSNIKQCFVGALSNQSQIALAKCRSKPLRTKGVAKNWWAWRAGFKKRSGSFAYPLVRWIGNRPINWSFSWTQNSDTFWSANKGRECRKNHGCRKTLGSVQFLTRSDQSGVSRSRFSLSKGYSSQVGLGSVSRWACFRVDRTLNTYHYTKWFVFRNDW